MNARRWRKRGYKVIFRHGTLYLYRPSTGVTVRTAIDKGGWMEHDNVNKAPWESLPAGDATPGLPPPNQITEHCYCDEGVSVCDFCGGVRPMESRQPRAIQQLIDQACEAEECFPVDELERFARESHED